MKRAIFTIVMLVLISETAFAECSGVTCQLVIDSSNYYWYECNEVRITQIAEAGEHINDFQVIDDRAVWCFDTTELGGGKAYYSNSVCGDEGSIIRITQYDNYNPDISGFLDHFQIVGDRAIWRYGAAWYDNVQMKTFWKEVYYFNSFREDGAQGGSYFSGGQITQDILSDSGPYIYYFQAGAGGRPNRVVWILDRHDGSLTYYYTCLPNGINRAGGDEQTIIAQSHAEVGLQDIFNFNVNGDIATWQCFWTDGQVTNHSKTLLACELASCDSAGVEKNQFSPGEDVYVKGEGIGSGWSHIWIQPDPVKSNDGLVIEKDPSGIIESVLVYPNKKGCFEPTLIWSIPSDFNDPNYEYDLIDDKGSIIGVGMFSVLTDTIDSVTGPGITITSEPNEPNEPNVPEPNLTISPVCPTTDINVPQNEFFEFTVDVNCTNGDCGDVEVGLSLASEGEWTPVESNRHWSAVAMSSTGQYQTAVDSAPGQIYISSNYGAAGSWTAVESNRFWYDIAMSSTGQYQTAVVGWVGRGQIYISSNYGIAGSWTRLSQS